jgi:serine/threonine protein kinase
MVTRSSQLCDVAKGLVYVHGQGLIHGDLKGVRLVAPKLDYSPKGV